MRAYRLGTLGSDHTAEQRSSLMRDVSNVGSLDGTAEFRATHLHYAVVDGWAVILDVLRNRYVSLTPEATRVWEYVNSGGAAPTIEELAAECGESPAESRRHVADQMLEWLRCGLLRKTALETPVPTARQPVFATSALDRSIIQATLPKPSSIAAFCLAAAQRRRRTRRGTLAEILTYIQSAQAAGALESITQLAATVRTYDVVRSLFSGGRDDCLDRSLDLALALRAQGIDARLCFGVRMFPFAAHAWVQVETLVVNDRLATIQEYTHIAQF